VADPFDVDHTDWSDAFGSGAVPGHDLPADDGGDGDAVSAAFDFEPDEVSSDEDYDFTGDGVVDHHDVHEVLTGFHDFHVEEPDTVHHEGLDHHADHLGDQRGDHLGQHFHHDGHDGGAELFGF
jgi:hypothetical protein